MNFFKKINHTISHNRLLESYFQQFLDSFTLLNHSSFAQKNLCYIDAFSSSTFQPEVDFQFSIPNTFCIIYTLQGQCTLTYNGFSYALIPGSVAFVDCNSTIDISTFSKSPWIYDIFFISGGNIFDYYELFTEDNINAFLTASPTSIPSKFETLLSSNLALWDNYNSELINSKLITDILTAIIIEKRANPFPQNILPTHVINAIEYINEHFADDVSLDSLASHLHVSKFSLSHDFSTYTGSSVIDYLISKRIEVSKKFLQATDLPIYEIGNQVGISNNTHFIQTFKKRVNVTPLQFRKQRNIHSLNHILDE